MADGSKTDSDYDVLHRIMAKLRSKTMFRYHLKDSLLPGAADREKKNS